MNQTTRHKLAVDLGMAVLLFVLMVYQLTGDFAHEWAGAAMLGLMVSGIISPGTCSASCPSPAGRQTRRA